MAHPATATWNLTQTSSDVVGVAKSFMQAASSDNVQVVALLACEAVGTTLAMSQAKIDVVHDLCSKEGSSAIIDHLKVQIGWRRGDSGHVLAQSNAGLRFLGLAAALITMDHWLAAQALEEIIKNTAEDKTLVPPTRQLKKLLGALEPRLARSTFCNDVLGCSVLLEGTLRMRHFDLKTPSVTTLAVLVKTLSALGRLGEAGRRAKLEMPYDQAAWMMALVKWSLGDLPTVTQSSCTIITGLPFFQIEILDEDLNGDIKLTVLDTLDTIVELVAGLPNGDGPTMGLMTIHAYGTRIMREQFGHLDDSVYSACRQAIPYACSTMTAHLSARNFIDKFATRQQSLRKKQVDVEYGSLFVNPDSLKRAMMTVLGSEDIDMPKNVTLSQIQELEGLRELRDRVKVLHTCHYCNTPDRIPLSESSRCQFHEVLDSIFMCAAEIFAIALLSPIEQNQIFVHYRSNSISAMTGHIRNQIRDSIESGYPSTSSIDDVQSIITLALEIIGHKSSGRIAHWTMSAGHGQCVWPEVLETGVCSKNNVIRLRCASGELMWENQKYELVSGRGGTFSSGAKHKRSSSKDRSLSVNSVKARNAYKQSKVVLRVSPTEKKTLTLSLACDDLPGIPLHNPRNVLEVASQSLRVNCPHDCNLQISNESGTVCETTPDNPKPPRGHIGIVQTDSNNWMRLFTLAGDRYLHVVIRENACLECCLLVCREFGFSVIVC